MCNLPTYDFNSKEHNFAMLELKTNLKFTEHIRPICIPGRGEDITNIVNKVVKSARKYGTIDVKILSKDVCEPKYQNYRQHLLKDVILEPGTIHAWK